MANYPEWVLKHKKKGTYINCVNGKYYLYAAHSERVPGTKKVRRISDGYIGRITEEDGLIPSRDKIAGDVVVYEYGLHITALKISGDILKGMRREFRTSAERVLVTGILLANGGAGDEEVFKTSYLSVIYPDMNYNRELTEKQRIGAERCARMVNDKLSGITMGNKRIMTQLGHVHAVAVNGKIYLSLISPSIMNWLKEHNIVWEEMS